MAKPPTDNPTDNPPGGPQRVPPSDAAADAVERIVPRRHRLEPGDVVIVRERVPRLDPAADPAVPVWRYRVRPPESVGEGLTFNSFQHAASEAERMATTRCTRMMYVEDDVPSLLADYRPSLS